MTQKIVYPAISNSITVITPTRKRVPLLQRALDSVKKQDCNAYVEHLILIDDCDNTLKFIRNFPDVKFRFLSREKSEVSGPARLAKIRNLGVKSSNSCWIAFLDDDNEFEKDHLSSLLETAKTVNSLAVHAQSKLFNSDGTPFLEHWLPWYRDKNIGREQYKKFCEMGMVKPGSNVLKSCVPKDVGDSGVNFVDTNEWLIDRCLLTRYPFVEYYDLNDWENIVTEDDKLLNTLINNKVAIACTNKATVRYYLGGYSNHNIDLQKPGEWVLE